MGYGMMGRGDYGIYRGDPGLFGFLKKVGGGLLRGVIGATPLGRVVQSLAGRGRGRRPPPPAFPGMRGLQYVEPSPGKRAIQQLLPFGKTGLEMRKRRRMNVANPKALRRAIRREQGFVKLAKKALKGTGYTVARRGGGQRRAPTVFESGPGGVTIQRR